MCLPKLKSFLTLGLLVTIISSLGSTLFAQERGTIRAQLVSMPAVGDARSLRAVAVAKDLAVMEEPDGPFQVLLSEDTIFHLTDLPMNRTLWISFLDASGWAIKTVATRIDIEHNPLDLLIDLSTGGDAEGINTTFAEIAQVSHALILDGQIYSPSDVLNIRYRVENLGQNPAIFNFPSGQRYDFVLLLDNTPVWKWSEERIFAQTLGSVELAPGQEVTYKATLKLAPLYLSVDRPYTLRGYLTALSSDTGEGNSSPQIELSFAVSTNLSPLIDISAGSATTVDGILDGTFIIEANTPVNPLKGKVEVLYHSENSGPSIPGYSFVQAVDLMPEVALFSAVTSLRVQMPFEEHRLKALNIQEENLLIFVLNQKGEVLEWQKIASSINQAENWITGTIEGFGTVGLFGSTGLIGDFDTDGEVNFQDFLAFVSGFGKRSGDQDFQPELDLDGNAEIGFNDFLTFVLHFGKTMQN